jgi:uroporphyrin-III C-methyltransferase/precorrin-2 dehydrogenase/sirohydrochlorin ferrochelatase/uroporphyrin-III C-methyltransferase
MEPSDPRCSAGKVFLIGAGPGDPELLTRKGARILASADTVVFDHLVSEGVLDLLPAEAERIYVGKEPGRHELPQPEINRLLIDRARAGRCVVRLKGGDPFVFGRGGEEIIDLAAAGVAFEVVPGITAASAAAAYAGIPLTHRGLTRACMLVSGHLTDGRCDLDWPALARPGQTIVVYMGVAAIGIICEQLIAHGLNRTTAAAAVCNASVGSQHTVVGTLADLPARLADDDMHPPAIIIIGDVVALRSRLDWFGH